MKKFFMFISFLSVMKAGFDAWDIDKNINERAISTKIAGKDFFITIASLDDKNKNFKKIKDKVCIRIKTENLTSPWREIEFKNEEKKNILLNYPDIAKEAKIEIKKCSKNRIYKSSDSFAIRAFKFVISIPKTLISQKSYFFKNAIKAVNYKGKTVNYENSPNLNYKKLNRKLKEDNTLKGVLKTESLKFKNGTANLNIFFSDTANVEIEIKDSNFSNIDKKDTPLFQRETLSKEILFFKIKKFSLSFLNPPSFENNDTNYTYLSNDLNMSARASNLSFEIKALGEKNQTLFNYKDPKDIYFANKIKIEKSLSIKPFKDLIIKDKNSSFIKDIFFKDGKAKVILKDIPFNYKRDFKRPKNPFFAKGKDSTIYIKTEDLIYKTKGEIISNFQKNALFFFAKCYFKDLNTNKTPSLNQGYIQIYCDKDCKNYFKNFEESEINWFINRYDSSTYFSVNSFLPKISPSLKDDFAFFTGVKEIKKANKGEIDFKIFTNKRRSAFAYFHVNIPSWLWKSDYFSYSFSNKSSCATHPCFKYIYTPPSFKQKTYKKESMDLIKDINVSIEKKYLKVFR